MTNIEKANELKALGNEAFKAKKYTDAINYFTQAIQQNPNDHTFFSNRSNSYVNAGDYQKALEDANSCIKYDLIHIE
jgi:stress-induced-phosphoprotein 1